jgi:hypothetical protein
MEAKASWVSFLAFSFLFVIKEIVHAVVSAGTYP